MFFSVFCDGQPSLVSAWCVSENV
ncbi:hypothetical protein FBUS_08901, partial [Fasciolopsis buskii]